MAKAKKTAKTKKTQMSSAYGKLKHADIESTYPKPEETETESEESDESLPEGTERNPEGINAGTPLIDFKAFQEMEGETFAGLNILKLNPGEAAGPIEIINILLQQKLGKDSAAKKRKPVDVYVGSHKGITMRLPIAASFISKAHEAKLAIGDIIALARGVDYDSAFNTKGANYMLKVLRRGATSKA